MNLYLVSRMLGIVAWLIGLTMALSLPIAWPIIGGQSDFESHGFLALVGSIVVCGIVGFVLRYVGKDASETLYRKEAMAIVGLSWVLATVLGGIPYYFGGVTHQEVDGVTQSMGIVDCLFESQSGFSTTGATVLTDVENEQWVPRCILCWRSSTHFLGGLGIIVLFVAVLGQGSAGKALMRAEMPGPSKEGSQERMQHTAWIFAAIYCGLTLTLIILLYFEGIFSQQPQHKAHHAAHRNRADQGPETSRFELALTPDQRPGNRQAEGHGQANQPGNDAQHP